MVDDKLRMGEARLKDPASRASVRPKQGTPLVAAAAEACFGCVGGANVEKSNVGATAAEGGGSTRGVLCTVASAGEGFENPKTPTSAACEPMEAAGKATVSLETADGMGASS
jgi:hypothetical protein